MNDEFKDFQTDMFIIDEVIQKEKVRNREMKQQFEIQLNSYPRGSLSSRERNGKKYYYLKYREGKKVVTKYAGTEECLDDLQPKIVARDELIQKLKKLDAEYEKIERIEKIK